MKNISLSVVTKEERERIDARKAASMSKKMKKRRQCRIQCEDMRAAASLNMSWEEYQAEVLNA